MDLRSRLSTLITVRVVVSTLLLGSAILVQINRPGAFPSDPFFFLIGLTYALSVLYLASLRFVDRHPWIADAQLGADAILVSAFIHVTGGITSYFSSLYLLPIMAASTVRFRRGALQVAALSAVLYLALVSSQYLEPTAFFPASWQAREALELPTARFAQYTVGDQPVRLLRGGAAVRIARREPEDDRREPGTRLDADCRPARVQPVRHRQHAERPGHRRHGRPHPDLQPRRGRRSPA